MKTPMQELIEQLNSVKPTQFCSIETIKGWAEEMLEKEKEVIMDAVRQGWDYNEEGLVRWLGENYYNETFNTKESI